MSNSKWVKLIVKVRLWNTLRNSSKKDDDCKEVTNLLTFILNGEKSTTVIKLVGNILFTQEIIQ